MTKEIDHGAIAEYLTLGYTLDWKTFWKGKNFTPKNINFPKLTIGSDVTIVDVKQALDEYFLNFDGKKVAVLLSGGKDSRIIAEMCCSLGLDTTAITFGYKKDSREYMIADKVCSMLDIPHLFFRLNPNIYSLDNLSESTLYCESDPAISPDPHYYYYRDILSKFDSVFSGETMTFPPREERFYQPKDKIERLLRTTSFDYIVKQDMREKIRQQFISMNYNKTQNEIFLQQIKNFRFKKFDVAKELFNIEVPSIDEDVLNTMWSLPETGIIKKVMKKYNFKTYNLPCTRSPFPLWFPWVIHYGYRYLKNFVNPIDAAMRSNMGMGWWSDYWNIYCKLIKDLATKLNLSDSLDFEFIDKNVVNQKLSAANKRQDYATSLEKLIKLKIWMR